MNRAKAALEKMTRELEATRKKAFDDSVSRVKTEVNEKYHIVAKVNIEFNPYQAQRFRDWVVISVEKNRGGQDNVDLEFEKHFEFSCFDPNGRTVQEKLIEERLYND